MLLIAGPGLPRGAAHPLLSPGGPGSEYDNLEAAFGKELEGIRKVDLRSKGDVLGRMDALAEDPAPGRYEVGRASGQDLWGGGEGADGCREKNKFGEVV